MSVKSTDEYDRHQIRLLGNFAYSFIGWFGSFIATSNLSSSPAFLKGIFLFIFFSSFIIWVTSGYKLIKLNREISNDPHLRAAFSDELSEHYKLRSCYYGMSAFVIGIVLAIFAVTFTTIHARVILELLLLFVISVALLSYYRLCRN